MSELSSFTLLNPISKVLTIWYDNNKRDLPWRDTSDPYCIWISEIILRQTRVSQGMEYYLRFVERFPDALSLAEASEQEVLTYWQGLGYYSRARNLHAAARQLVDKYGGRFPTNYEEVRALKGIGDYTAAAICSIAYNLPFAVVDGNVYRVLARLFAIETPIDTTQGKKEFQELAQQLINPLHPGLHNQAMMEFGALVCVPVNPGCETCPLQYLCRSYELKLVAQLPVKSKKTAIKELFYTYLHLRSGQKILLQPRSKANNIWKNMYEFPLIEASYLLSPTEILAFPLLYEMATGKIIVNSRCSDFTHILSHRKINARFIEIQVEKFREPSSGRVITTLEALSDFPLPRLITRYLEGMF